MLPPQGGVFGAVATSDAFVAALSPGAGPAANGLANLANGVSKPERTVTVTAEPYDYELPAHRAALIMIDFQKDFMLPGGFGDALGNKIELLKVRRSALAACITRADPGLIRFRCL